MVRNTQRQQTPSSANTQRPCPKSEAICQCFSSLALPPAAVSSSFFLTCWLHIDLSDARHLQALWQTSYVILPPQTAKQSSAVYQKALACSTSSTSHGSQCRQLDVHFPSMKILIFTHYNPLAHGKEMNKCKYRRKKIWWLYHSM